MSSNFPLAPTPTLSSVLDADETTLGIAPELMSDQTSVPSKIDNNNASNQQTESSFMSDTPDGVPSWSDTTGFPGQLNEHGGNVPHDWDIYSDQQKQHDDPFGLNAQNEHHTQAGSSSHGPNPPTFREFPLDRDLRNDQAVTAGSDNPRPKKRAKTTTKRSATGGSLADPSSNPTGLDEAQLAEAEYEDPSRNWTLGPIFVQPPKGTAQACVRCHRIKRKCDGARPRCAGCTKAGVACVFELSPATSSWVQTLKDSNVALSAQLISAHERLAQLEALVGNSSNSTSNGVHEKPYDAAEEAAAVLFAEASASNQSHNYGKENGEMTTDMNGDMKYRAEFADLARTVLSLGQNDIDPALSLSHPSSPLPLHEDCLQMLDVAFDRYPIVVAILDRRKITSILGVLLQRNGKVENDEEFLAAAALTLGCITTSSAEDFPKTLWTRLMSGVPVALSNENLVTIKSLILLSILGSAVSPSIGSVPVPHLLSLAMSLAVSLHLHRMSSTEIDQAERLRVWWSLYYLDRTTAVTAARPVTIRDEDVDVPDLAISDKSIDPNLVFLVRHSRIQSRIHTSMYSPSVSQAAEESGQRLIAGIHAELSQLLQTSSALPSLNQRKKDWLQFRTDQTLCLLYRPSPLCPSSSATTLKKLYSASTSAIQYCLSQPATAALLDGFEEAYRYLVCMSLLYALSEYNNAKTYHLIGFDNSTWPVYIEHRLEQCRTILGNSGRGGKYEQVLDRLSTILLSRISPSSSERTDGQDSEDIRSVMRRLLFNPESIDAGDGHVSTFGGPGWPSNGETEVADAGFSVE